MDLKANPIQQHMRQYATFYLFTTILFLMGIIFGAVLVNSMGFIQKQDLSFYLEQFFQDVLKEPVFSTHTLFQMSALYNLKTLLLIFILGLSIIGMPVIWFILFVKGLVVGFTVGFLVNQMGWHGFLLASGSVALQNVLLIPVFILAASLAMIFSYTLMQNLFAKRLKQPLLPPFMRYVTLFALIGGIVVIAAGIEAYLSSQAMKSIVSLIIN